MLRALGFFALALPACSSTSPPASHCSSANLVVAASDEQEESAVGTVALTGCAALDSSMALGPDPALSASHGRVFFINRHVGNVFELDPSTGIPISRGWLANDAKGPPGNSNPQDVAVAPDGSLWVARLDESSVLRVSSDGQQQLGTIDLSRVTGKTRNPYMSSIRTITLPGGTAKAYLTLEMLAYDTSSDDLLPDGPSYLVRIDVATGKVDDLLTLKGQNPFGLMVEYDDKLYLAEPGSFYKADETNAGIEVVDLATFTSDLLVKESDIGASVAQVSITHGCATAIVADPSENNYTSLISFDPASGIIHTPLSQKLLYTDAGYELEGMTWLEDGGVNVVGDRTGVVGKGYALHVLQASDVCVLTEKEAPVFVPAAPVAFQPVP